MSSPAIEIVAVVVAIGTFMFYVWQEGRAKKTQLSAMYLQRYWQIDDDLLTTDKGTKLHQQNVHRLLILTEDEFEAAQSRHLDPTYWTKWHAWIAHPEQRKKRYADLELVDPEARSFEHLRSCLGAPGAQKVTAHDSGAGPCKPIL